VEENKKMNVKLYDLLIIIWVVTVFVSLGLILGDASLENKSWEAPNSNVSVTKTVTAQGETITLTQYEDVGILTRTVTAYRTNTTTKTFHNVEPPVTLTVTATKTIYENRTIPAFENNTAFKIDRYLLDRLNTARELRGLDGLTRNRDLESMAKLNKIEAWTEQTNQIFTLTSYTLTRNLDECWRGDLYVAETILTRLGEDYDYVIYSATTHGVGIHVDVALYKIYVRCVFLGA